MRILTILLDRAEYQQNKSVCSKLDHTPSERCSFTFQTTQLTSLPLDTNFSKISPQIMSTYKLFVIFMVLFVTLNEQQQEATAFPRIGEENLEVS